MHDDRLSCLLYQHCVFRHRLEEQVLVVRDDCCSPGPQCSVGQRQSVGRGGALSWLFDTYLSGSAGILAASHSKPSSLMWYTSSIRSSFSRYVKRASIVCRSVRAVDWLRGLRGSYDMSFFLRLACT